MENRDVFVNIWDNLRRGLSKDDLKELLTEAYSNNRLLCWKLICGVRNFRDNGKGERDLFLDCLEVMVQMDVDSLILNFPILLEQGRMDDFYKLGKRIIIKSVKNDASLNEYKLLDHIVSYYADRFERDMILMEGERRVSLLGKWADHQKGNMGMTILVINKMGLIRSMRGMDEGIEDLCKFFFGEMGYPVGSCKIGKKRVYLLRYVRGRLGNLLDWEREVVRQTNEGLKIFRKSYLVPLGEYIKNMEMEKKEMDGGDIVVKILGGEVFKEVKIGNN